MNNRRLFTYFAFSTLIFALFSCNGKQTGSNNVVYDSIEARHTLPGTSEILSRLQKSADLVTTEVKIRKVAIYDSSKSEKFAWKDPSTWKYGDKKCVIPVEVTIKYGYDLSELTNDKIKLTDDSTAVIVILPKPKIIDAGYNAKIDEGSIISISTGLRSKIGHELQEEIRRKGYESILKEDFSSVIDKDIENNAKTIYESLIKSLGWKNVQIITTHNK